MRYVPSWLIILLFLLQGMAVAQGASHQPVKNTVQTLLIDSLRMSKKDSLRLIPLIDSLSLYFFENADSTIYFAEKVMDGSRGGASRGPYIYAMQLAGEAYRSKGDFPKSLSLQLESIRESRQHNFPLLEGKGLSFIGITYLFSGLYEPALRYILPARPTLERTDTTHGSFNVSNAAYCYTMLGKLDSARLMNDLSIRLFTSVVNGDFRKSALRTLIYARLGLMYEKLGQADSAKAYYRLSTQFATRDKIPGNTGQGNNYLARLFLNEHQYDSAIYFSSKAYAFSQESGFLPVSVEASEILARAFEAQGKADSALHYLNIAVQARNSIAGPEKYRQLQVLVEEEKDRQRALEAERVQVVNRQRILLMGGAIAALLLVALILRRNNRTKHLLNQQLTEQKSNLEITVETLRSTQKQLVQSEKMASLGELTAGIAHEIQNPLNFVNNFSDLNREMIDELKDELKKGDLQQVARLAENIRENEEKISQHGKRADGIVKSMLQHSRSSSGVKGPTDVNKLVDEYVRLAYHGCRARQKDFNAKLDIDLDPSLGTVHMVAQDIGRVLLNLLNNAFYAVQEGAKTAGPGYTPTVTIRTGRSDAGSGIRNSQSIIIDIGDNGQGIPVGVREKIFQPFFTTKPTGQGTGLGLSLSYDIVTQGHRGTLSLLRSDAQGTLFRIELPDAP